MFQSFYIRAAVENLAPISLPLPQSGVIIDLRMILVGALDGSCTFFLATPVNDSLKVHAAFSDLSVDNNWSSYFHSMQQIYSRRDVIYLSDQNPPILLPITDIVGADVDIAITIKGVQW